MASFTDIIPKFNPYVQQLPVEAMVQVGMEKQKRYDEGIQKIQAQIDQVGGLDIYKQNHKAYLQSKLNELGNNLKGVAAGDFSNFQLVNSVGGMIGQISKDPVIRNAYESTQLLRKQQGYMEEAKKAGKSSPENEWWFINQIDRWQNDPDLMKKFTGEYVQYTDIDKKLRDVASKIKEIEKSVDIPYVRDAAGNVILGKDNKPIVDDAMLRIKVKGTPAEKILNNFYSSLNESDKQQLMITANYHYRNADKSKFQNDIINTYNSQKKAALDNLSKLSVELKTNDKLTSTQKAEIEAVINKNIDKINSGYFEKEANKKIDEIDKVTNIEDFKYRVYTQKYLTGLAQDLSNESYTEEILSNPYAQMNMEKKKLEFQVNRARQEHQEFLMDYGLAASRLDVEQKEKDAEKRAGQPIVDYGGLGTGVKPPTLNDLNLNIENTEKQITSLKNSARSALFPNLSGEAQDKALDELVDQYIANPFSIKDNDERSYVEQMRQLQIKKSRQSALYNSTLEHSAPFNADIKNAFKGFGGVVDKNGKELFSAEDLYVARSKIYEFTKVSDANKFGIKPTVTFDYNGYVNSLPAKLRPLAVAIGKSNTGQPLTNTEKIIVQRAQVVNDNFRPVVTGIYKNKTIAESKFLAERMPEVQTTFGTLNMDDKITKQRVDNLIGNATKRYDELKSLDVITPSDFNPETLSGWRTGKGSGDLKYVVEKNYDGSGKLIVYKGTDKQIIPLTGSDLISYFPDVAKSSFMTDVKYDIMDSPGRTTNTIGREVAVGAKYSGYDIPGLRSSQYASMVRWDVEGAKENNGGQFDRYQVRMYAFNGNTWIPAVLNQQGFVTAAGVEEIINNIGPGTVQEVLSQK